MKKNSIVILLLLTVLLIGGGFMIWKLSSNKEKVSSSSSQQKKNLPLNELSDRELEKCLLEDFSRRLELEKYFVFNLGGEVKTAKQEKTGFENSRFITSKLSQDLTKLTSQYEKKVRSEWVWDCIKQECWREVMWW